MAPLQCADPQGSLAGERHAPRSLRDPRPLRPARQPALPRRDDLRRRPRLGLQRRGVAADHRPLHRARRQLHRHRELLHQEPLREDHRRPRRAARRAARPARHRDQVQRQPLSGRSQRRRLGPQVDHRRLRELAAPPADRLHRSVLAAQLGRAHADRGDDGRARGSRARRQGALPRRLRHAGVEGRRGQRHGALPRLVGVHRAADRVLAARAHRRAGARADGARARPRHHAVVAAQERRAERQVHAQERRAGQGGPRRRSSTPSSTRRPTPSSTSSRSSPRRTTAPSRASRSPGCRRSRA